MILLCLTTDWWQVIATFSTGIIMAIITLHWNRKTYRNERRAKFQGLQSALDEIGIRSNMMGLVTVSELEANVSEHGGLRDLASFSTYGYEMMNNLAKAHDNVAIYLSKKHPINFDAYYQLSMELLNLQPELMYIVSRLQPSYIQSMPMNAQQELAENIKIRIMLLKEELHPNEKYGNIEKMHITHLLQLLYHLLRIKYIYSTPKDQYVEQPAWLYLKEVLSTIGCYQTTIQKINTFLASRQKLFDNNQVQKMIDQQIKK